MMIIKRLSLLLLFTALLSLMPLSVHAISNTGAACSGAAQAIGSAAQCDKSSSTRSVMEVTRTFVDIFAWIVGVVAVVVVILAGMRFMMSAGDVAAVTASRKQLIYALVGLVIVVNAGLIVHFVLSNAVKHDQAHRVYVATSARADEAGDALQEAENALEEANNNGDESEIDEAQEEYNDALSDYLDAQNQADSAADEVDEPTSGGTKPGSGHNGGGNGGGKNNDHNQASDDNFRIATFNIRFDAAIPATVVDVQRLSGADIIALQEAGNDAHVNAIRKKFVSCESCAFDMYAPRDGIAASQHVLMWRKDSFKKLDAGSMVAAAGSWSWIPQGLRINWVKLESKASGRTVFALSNHLPAHVEDAGGYRASEPSRVQAYGMYMNTITSFMQQHTSPKSAVFAVGDFNVGYQQDKRVRAADFPYASMNRIGATSNFEALGATNLGTHVDVNPGGCTTADSKGARIIDYIFVKKINGLSFSGHHIIPSTCSDHNAVSASVKWQR